MARSSGSVRLQELLGEVKLLAREYHVLAGRPLGVTGEMAEYEAARILGLELAVVRQAGYDAIRKTPGGDQLLEIRVAVFLAAAVVVPNGSVRST